MSPSGTGLPPRSTCEAIFDLYSSVKVRPCRPKGNGHLSPDKRLKPWEKNDQDEADQSAEISVNFPLLFPSCVLS